jgi:hypothetical protein
MVSFLQQVDKSREPGDHGKGWVETLYLGMPLPAVQDTLSYLFQFDLVLTN